ncbi:MAG: hypothetical protein KA715_02110 [Xanthomonadaceae bacterium]|nr:hypothetical protein [Xanthomonadaceae bacterium]
MKKIILGLALLNSVSVFAADRTYSLNFESGLNQKSHQDEVYETANTKSGVRVALYCFGGSEDSISVTKPKLSGAKSLWYPLEAEKCKDLVELVKSSKETPVEVIVQDDVEQKGRVVSVNTKH